MSSTSRTATTRLVTASATILATALAIGMGLGGCGSPGDAGSTSADAVSSLVHGSAPGGVAGSWAGEDGTEIILADDGIATVSIGGIGMSGTWQQDDDRTAEVFVASGKAWRAFRDGDSLTLASMDDLDDDGEPREGAKLITLSRTM